MSNASRDQNHVTTLLAISDADGSVRTLEVADATDRLKVDAVITGGSSSGTEYTQGDTDTTITGPAVLGEAPSSTLQPIQLDASNNLKISIEADNAGIGGGTQYAVDDAAGGTDTGTLALAIRDDTLSTLTPVDGDYVGLRVSSTGALHVTGGGGGTEYTEDVATANPQVGTATMIERDDALSTVTPIEGDWIGLRGSAEGALWTQDFNSDGILSDTTAIKTAVEIIDNAISGSEMQVDVVGSLPAGTNAIGKLSANSGVDIGDVDVLTLPSDTFVAEGGSLGKGVLLQGDDGTDRKNINVDATTGDVQVDVTNTVTVDLGANNDVTVTGTVDLGATDNAVLDAIESNTDGIETLLGTIDSDTNDIKTAVQLIDNAISGSEMQVDVVTMPTTNVESDGTAMAMGQASVTTSSAQKVAASAGRAGVLIKNIGSVDCYIGSGTVATTTGMLLEAGESISLPTDSSITAITASSTTTLAYLTFA